LAARAKILLRVLEDRSIRVFTPARGTLLGMMVAGLQWSRPPLCETFKATSL
jgi:hypothetical protein